MNKIKDNPFKFTPSVILFPLLFVLSLWIVFWVEHHYHVDFGHYGIYPRTGFGLKGIIFSSGEHKVKVEVDVIPIL